VTRLNRAISLLASVALGVLLASGVAMAALPSETPDPTHMVNGPVRTFAQVGTNLWVGGNFTQVKTRGGSVVASVSNVAVFDAATGAYKPAVAPRLTGTRSKVTEMKVYGTSVLIGGRFSGPSSTQKNLVAVNGVLGVGPGAPQPRWYDSVPLESLLAAPDLGRVYAGGQSLSAFDFITGRKLWTRAKTTVDGSLYTHELSPGYRDLERDGSTIWAACGCDAVDGRRAKALVKLSTDGAHDASWVAEAGIQAFGISLVQDSANLYLAAGGNDFLARYPKAAGGRWSGGAGGWWRDTSGSAQVVEVADGQLVVGGHFWEVADQQSDGCGFRSSNNAQTLDPDDECQTRKGLAAYSFSGTLQPWDPVLAGEYNLAWALHPEGTRLHVGGEFTTVSGVKQTYYARLS
jgi:hypothetical protein